MPTNALRVLRGVSDISILETTIFHVEVSSFLFTYFPLGQGAVSTAKFTGVRLRDLLIAAGVTDPVAAQQEDGMEHVRFYGVDGMTASIDMEKAVSPYGDCIVAYEMNDAPLPRDHGFPLRVVVPGYAAVRNVKWLERIELSTKEAEGVWQRGLNYKPLPPGVTDASTVNLSEMPSITELSLYSGITKMDRLSSSGDATSSFGTVNPGDQVMLKVSGWAYAGGGRNVVRVDVTGDEGKTWATATLKEGSNQRFRRAWAWVFWECDLPAVVGEDGAVHVASKAVDMAFNVQPESNVHMWNVRGLGNNSWYRAHAKVMD
jgi:sulfite oxidase